jgi:hypothetical protein
LICNERGQLTARAEPEEIAFLRSYRNYLTPRLGVFSGDTLAAFLSNTAVKHYFGRRMKLLGAGAVLRERELSDLIGDIFDCAIDPTLWNSTLPRIAEFMNTQTA